NIETYLPMLWQEKSQRNQKRVVKVPLFPSYLFIQFDPDETSVRQIHSTRGVNYLVNCQERMVPLDDRIIHTIRMKELSAFDKKTAESVPLSAGQKVKFTEGPFADLEGVFQEQCPNKRCQVLFTIMGQEKTINVPEQSLKPIE
ncbi:MAG: transcription/translation regulatory transformer protein RfaH, partial [Shewanella sp.]